MNQVIENLLRIPRLRHTLSAAKTFDSTIPTPASTDPQSQYNMRSSMDFHPKVGKWVSRKSISANAPEAGKSPAGLRVGSLIRVKLIKQVRGIDL